ncbi:DUF983 domain-containing protein [uncultured Flavobacterium sp.]|uniref:DUF983 domain-containing protein n=1 Tax=uncultured Flavobacterium sp. TaxID=165435 RepID=UPI0030C7CE39
MFNNTLNILKNKCPNCHNGDIFKHNLFHFSFSFPKMHKKCNHCQTKFEKEPGFFFGAMFVSYAIGVAEAIITYLIASLFFDKNFDLRIITIIAIVIIALTRFNIKLSRIIWIYLFKNYTK